LFVGYQAPNTLGRRLLNGEKKVKIFGEEIDVKAKIEFIEAYSGHADKNGLIKWIDSMGNKPKRIFVVHGEKDAQLEFSEELKMRFNVEVDIPSFAEHYSITAQEVFSKQKIYIKSEQYPNLAILAQIDDINDDIEEIKERIKSVSFNIDKLKILSDDVEELRYLVSLIKNSL